MIDSLHPMVDYRPAEKTDAREIAALMNIAGEGIPEILWFDASRGARDPLAVGACKAARERANFSYRNVKIAAADGCIAGMSLAYRLPEPTPGDIDALEALPDLVRPMVELEYEVGGSYYLNALAVRSRFRRRGIGTRLLQMLPPLARRAECSLLSLAVFAGNEEALRLYRRERFDVVAERPVAEHPRRTSADRILMLAKPV